MVGKRAAVIGLTNDPAEIAFERTIKVDLLHVVGIEELPAPPPSPNGPAAQPSRYVARASDRQQTTW
jgi:hypothetical protein